MTNAVDFFSILRIVEFSSVVVGIRAIRTVGRLIGHNIISFGSFEVNTR